MRRIGVLLLVLAVAVLVASQLLVPAVVERRAEDRLERHGGTAKVSVSALPAVRLLFGDGDSITVKASGVSVEPQARDKTLERLDGYDRVSVKLEHLTAEPLDVRTFTLFRDEGERDYHVRIGATTSASRVGAFVGSQAGGSLGGLFGGLAGGSLPGGAAEVPLRVDALLSSGRDGVEVRTARGSIAGVPAGPLAVVVAAAVADRL